MKSYLFPIILLLLLLFGWDKASSQTSRLKKLVLFQDKIQGLDLSRLSTDSTLEVHRDTINQFLEVFREVRNNELDKSILKGKINFGFNGNQSSPGGLFNQNNNSAYNIIGGLSLKRGDYPSQLQLETQLNVSIVMEHWQRIYLILIFLMIVTLQIMRG